MENKNTPGPWTFSTDRFDNHRVLIPCHPSQGDPTMVSLFFGFTEECKANAVLVSQAPVLLQAAKRALIVITKDVREGRCPSGVENSLREAIEAAEQSH